MSRQVVFCLVMASLLGCASSPPPYEDYTLARAALKSARDTDAPRLAPLLYLQAEELYRQAERNYRENDFDAARAKFASALKTAERAENGARLKKFLSGQGAP